MQMYCVIYALYIIISITMQKYLMYITFISISVEVCIYWHCTCVINEIFDLHVLSPYRNINLIN